MAENLRSDGKAVDVTLGSAFNDVDVKKGDLILADGWIGIAMHDGTKGDTIAIETTQREFVLSAGDIAAAKGDILYADTSSEGKLTLATDNTKTPVLKVTKAKDTNNYVWAKLIPQVGQGGATATPITANDILALVDTSASNVEVTVSNEKLVFTYNAG